MGLLPTSKHRAASHDEGAGHDADGQLGKPATAKGRSGDSASILLPNFERLLRGPCRCTLQLVEHLKIGKVCFSRLLTNANPVRAACGL